KIRNVLQNCFMMRLVEDAADEIARLDVEAAGAPFGADLLLRLEAILRLTTLAEETSPSDSVRRRRLLAAEVDPYHEAALDPRTTAWMTHLREEVRRARGGALPTLERWREIIPSLTTYPHGEALEASWRDDDREHRILAGAVAAAAWAPDAATGDAIAAVLLVARGRTADLRLLPFHALPASARDAACAAYRAGDRTGWETMALQLAADAARRWRARIAAIVSGVAAEEDRLTALGRAGHTARRALPLLRRQGALTMPILAEDLGISRPAATDALERMAAAGCAVELTGRARDRVWGYAPLVQSAP
ncbi:MAG: hypothetical protein ACKOCV_03055, partial [Gemmatimonadota bacterium]